MPVDPRVILEQIAADKTQPATARVSAAKALLGLSRQTPEEKGQAAEDNTMKRALELVASGGKRIDR